tara:strand:- start:240 stop:398 length:159 start_codon:yes stop_codon:yes gene_type:complete
LKLAFFESAFFELEGQEEQEEQEERMMQIFELVFVEELACLDLRLVAYPLWP